MAKKPTFKMRDVDNISTRMDEMLKRTSKIQGYLNRVIYPLYQKAQVKRWRTEGASETGPWKQLGEKYLKWRQRHFPAAGERIGIRSAILAPSMTGATKKDHFKMVTKNELIVGSTLFYAGYFDEDRDINEFSARTEDKWRKNISDYVVNGTMKPRAV